MQHATREPVQAPRGIAAEPRRALPWSALLLLLASGCAGADAPDERAPESAARANRRPPGPAGPLDRILEIEAARDDRDGELLRILRDATPRLRARAALALARFQVEDLGAPATEALVRALDDPDPRVRENAAFGLGLRGDPAAATAIAGHARDPEPSVRAALAEAATRIADPSLVPVAIRALDDPEPAVRAAAALGMHRWPWVGSADAAPEHAALAESIDEALVLCTLRPVVRDGAPLAGFEASAGDDGERPEDYEVVWSALSSLERRRAALARDSYMRFAVGAAPFEARLFATRGLARGAHDNEVLTRLASLAYDDDWRVAVEALRGIGAASAGEFEPSDHAHASQVAAVAAALGHPSTHVRIAAWEALAEERRIASVSHLLRRFDDEDEPPARAAAALALAKLRGDRAGREIEALAESEDVVERAGAATAAAELPSELARPLLLRLSADPHPKVVASAVAGLPRHLDAEARLRLRALLESPDAAYRLSAALALRGVAEAADVPSLEVAARTSSGDSAAEARFEAARTLAGIDDEDARRALRGMLDAERDAYVRRVVRGLLGESEPDAVGAAAVRPADGERSARVWRGSSPRVTFVTDRGELRFELLARDAPMHVINLLELIRRGAYDGTTWHRVVPDFVIQGGDPRGDGNGAGTWRGPDDALRLEVTRRPFRTGSLGMPRNEDRDSGGRQIFVTHRLTPHLDGRYTLFGELLEGFDVLARIQEGDRILTARIDAE